MIKKKHTILIHPVTGERRKVKNGMAWTVFFFTGVALLFRRQFKLSGICFAMVAILVIVEIFILEMIFGINLTAFTNTVIALGFGCGFGGIANESLVKQLQKKGYEIHSLGDEYQLNPYT